MVALLTDELAWDNAPIVDIAWLLGTYSLHDSSFDAVSLIADTGMIASIVWSHRLSDGSLYGAVPAAESEYLPPGSLTPPKLLIRFDGFCQLRELTSRNGPDWALDVFIQEATTRRLSRDEVEQWIGEVIGERDPGDALVRRLLESEMVETEIEAMSGYQVRLMHSTPVRVLVVADDGNLLPLPPTPPEDAP